MSDELTRRVLWQKDCRLAKLQDERDGLEQERDRYRAALERIRDMAKMRSEWWHFDIANEALLPEKTDSIPARELKGDE